MESDLLKVTQRAEVKGHQIQNLGTRFSSQFPVSKEECSDSWARDGLTHPRGFQALTPLPH